MATSNAMNTSNQYVKYTISINQNSRDINNNKSNVTVSVRFYRTNTGYTTYGSGTVYCKIDGTQYSASVGPTQKITNSGIVLFTKTLDISHNGDGKKTLTCSAWINHNAPLTSSEQSYSQELTAIPRQANLTAAPNFNDEQNPTITYSNPAGNAVDSLQACIILGDNNDISYRGITKTGTSYTFDLTEEEREKLRNSCNNANSRNVTFCIETIIGGKGYYSTITKTLTIVNASPTLYPIIEDTNDYVVSLTGKASKLVKYFSSPLVETGSSAKKGAWITNNAMSNGNKYTTNASDTFYNVDNAVFGFWAKDSRGNEVYQEINKINEGNWIDYVKITCNATPTNPTTDGKMTLNINGNYWNGNFGAVANYLTLQYRMAVVGTDFPEWVTIPAEIYENTYNASVDIEGLDYQTTYKFEVRALDKLETTPIRYFEVQTTPVFDWGKNDFSFNVPVNNLNPLPIDLPNGNGDAEYWFNLKPGTYWYDMNRFNVGGMPSGWGFVVKTGYVAADYSVIFYTQAEGPVYRRSGNHTNDSGWIILNGIIESGSNENGNWIKYSNGTMICYGNKIFGVDITDQRGYMYQGEVLNPFTFPQPFITQPQYVNVSIGSYEDYTFSFVYATRYDAESIFDVMVLIPDYRDGGTVPLNYFAVGRWQ